MPFQKNQYNPNIPYGWYGTNKQWKELYEGYERTGNLNDGGFYPTNYGVNSKGETLQINGKVNDTGGNNGMGIVGEVAGDLSNAYSASIAPDIMRGHFFTGSDDFSHGRMAIYAGRLSITKDYAESIDDFFDKFGYATRKNKVPNITSRPHWNYVKTVSCSITGSVPSDDLALIENIFDRGITFWKNPSEVGNYGLDNRA